MKSTTKVAKADSGEARPVSVVPEKGGGAGVFGVKVWRSRLFAFWKKFLSLEGAPSVIAGGLAVGVFFALTPFWGIKTVLALAVAALLRTNPVAAFIGLTAFDFITPLVPLMLRFQYDTGYWLLSEPHAFPPEIEWKDFHPKSFFRWDVFVGTGIPLLVGSFLWAFPAASAVYFCSFSLLQKRKNRAAKQAPSPEGGQNFPPP